MASHHTAMMFVIFRDTPRAVFWISCLKKNFACEDDDRSGLTSNQ